MGGERSSRIHSTWAQRPFRACTKDRDAFAVGACHCDARYERLSVRASAYLVPCGRGHRHPCSRHTSITGVTGDAGTSGAGGGSPSHRRLERSHRGEICGCGGEVCRTSLGLPRSLLRAELPFTSTPALSPARAVLTAYICTEISMPA